MVANFRRSPLLVLVAIGIGVLALVVVSVLLVPHTQPGVPLSSEPLLVLRTGGDGPDKIQTGPNIFTVSCPTDYITGDLRPDAVYGVVIVSNAVNGPVGPVPVIWPIGYTGRRTPDGQVDVVDKDGRLMVTTGTRVRLEGGYGGQNPDGSVSWQACDGGFSAAQ